MTDQREWFRLSVVGVAALIGIPIPGDVISLALDRVFAQLDGARQASARGLSTRIADALLSLAHGQDGGTVESARLTTQELLARYGLSDEQFAGYGLDPIRAADTVLASRTFTPAEREVLPLCRRLLICVYESLLSDPATFVELLPHSHREQLRRLGTIDSKLDALGTEVRAGLTKLQSAITADDRQLVDTLVDSQWTLQAV
jgi:hypothetical protein